MLANGATPCRRNIQQTPEVGMHRGLPAADVDVEDLVALQFIDYRLAFGGRQFPRVGTPGARQAVDASAIAGVRQLPRQADGRFQAKLKVVDQPAGERVRAWRRRRGYADSRDRIIPERASEPSATPKPPRRSVSTPTAEQASRADACAASARTTSTKTGSFSMESRRERKSYASAPKRSGRSATPTLNVQGRSRSNATIFG